MLKVSQTTISGVKLIIPTRFEDSRGFFSTSWHRAELAEIGIDVDFVQDNHSLSKEAGTMRGLHFQVPPHAQAKLVRCGRGRLFDVAVDIRKGSPAFGQWTGAELSFENGRQMLIPAGFMHGFVTLEPDTEIIYKCSDYYAPECDRAVRFDDSDIAVEWEIDPADAILSDKDAGAPLLREINSPFIFEG